MVALLKKYRSFGVFFHFARDQLQIIKRMLDRSMPAIPKANFTICDVRDVAEAHYKAMTIPDAVGKCDFFLFLWQWFQFVGCSNVCATAGSILNEVDGVFKMKKSP